MVRFAVLSTATRDIGNSQKPPVPIDFGSTGIPFQLVVDLLGNLNPFRLSSLYLGNTDRGIDWWLQS